MSLWKKTYRDSFQGVWKAEWLCFLLFNFLKQTRCSNDEGPLTTGDMGIGLLALAQRQGWKCIHHYGYHLENFVLPVLALTTYASEEEIGPS